MNQNRYILNNLPVRLFVIIPLLNILVPSFMLLVGNAHPTKYYKLKKMEFEWDENKRQTNIIKHGIDFIDSQKIFNYDTVIIEDNRFNYGEQRLIALGLLKGKIIVVVYTERKNTIRIISARKATKNEQQIYFNEIYD